MAPIAKEDKVVYDDNLGIKRKIFAGQPVPADLVGAYNAATGGSVQGDEEVADPPAPDAGYDRQKIGDLEDEAKRRGIYDAIEGTGADGNVVKADLVAALEANDAS